jgi:hypothetical protein
MRDVGTFLVVTALLVVRPGVDMALVSKNALFHGRRVALLTALGINGGIVVWTAAAALGPVHRPQGSTSLPPLRVPYRLPLSWLSVPGAILISVRRGGANSHGCWSSRRLEARVDLPTRSTHEQP